ncbi:MAG TPA: GNAT family N-acetyltransferase [Verrucomicrobiae bacterium]|nr:GNAT family N-acetyltransferase [Verrucomicrobiae bacterium]
MIVRNTPNGVVLFITRRRQKIEVNHLTVAPDLQGRGLGTGAMRDLQKLGQPIELTAVPDPRKRKALHRFYTSLGFRPIRKTRYGCTVFQWTPGGGK